MNKNYDYKRLTPFKWFVLQNFPFIDEDFDAITNYQLFCKLGEEINKIIDSQNIVGEQAETLTNAFNTLKNYVDNYFNNLDVQDEINNKLNEMVRNGELQNLLDTQYLNLKNEVNNTLDLFSTDINNKINSINNKVISLASGSPLVASNVSEMTNINKIYVNTTNGKWYYYDNENWNIGGDYQSTSISNNSIDILKLDVLLQENFNTSFSNDIDLGPQYAGYCYIENNEFKQNINDTNYLYHKIDLKLNDILIISGYNNLIARCLIIVDNNNNIVYDSGSGNKEFIPFSDIIKVNDNNLKAYISLRNITTLANERYYSRLLTSTRIRKLNNISNNLKINTNIPLLETIENFNVIYTNQNPIGEQIKITTINDTKMNIKIYPIEKGKTYKVIATNIYSVRGLVLTDDKYNITYVSSTENVDPANKFEYSFTPSENGYAFISNYRPSIYGEGSIECVIPSINNTSNILKNKKLVADGDSITNGADGIGYPEYIAQNNEMEFLENLAVNGATIATGTTFDDNTNRHWICKSVENLNNTAQYILIGGGVNDFWNNVPLGEITNNYNDDVNTNTFIGALEYMARILLNKYNKDQHIYFIIYHNILNIFNNHNDINLTFNDYYNAIIQVMNKYSINVIDLHKISKFNTGINFYKNNYTFNQDGIHPNAQGYEYFYNNIISNIMKLN